MSTVVHKCARCGCELRGESPEVQTVITVRMSKSLHEALKRAAHDRESSLNALCVEQLGLLAEAAAAEDLAHVS